MPQYCHRVTGIPPGSTVELHACGRFRQFHEVVHSGSVDFVASKPAYPIKIKVRATQAFLGPGGVVVLKPMAGSIIVGEINAGQQLEATVRDHKDFNSGTAEEPKEHYLPDGSPWIEGVATAYPATAETALTTRCACDVCGMSLEHGRYCTEHTPKTDGTWAPSVPVSMIPQTMAGIPLTPPGQVPASMAQAPVAVPAAPRRKPGRPRKA